MRECHMSSHYKISYTYLHCVTITLANLTFFANCQKENNVDYLYHIFDNNENKDYNANHDYNPLPVNPNGTLGTQKRGDN